MPIVMKQIFHSLPRSLTTAEANFPVQSHIDSLNLSTRASLRPLGTDAASDFESQEVHMLTAKQVEGNWNQIKSGIRGLWRDLRDEDLDDLKGNLNGVVQLVQEKYLESTDSIQDKLEKLMDSFDNYQDRNLIRNDHVTSYMRNPTSERRPGEL